jgi:hypothetical protein
METVDTRTFKQKVKDFFNKKKEAVLDAKDKVVQAAKDHPYEAYGLLCISIPGLLKLLNSIVRLIMQAREDRYDDCDYYDPRTGEHWQAKRPLSKKQKLNLEKRYKEGESKGKILNDMHML